MLVSLVVVCSREFWPTPHKHKLTVALDVTILAREHGVQLEWMGCIVMWTACGSVDVLLQEQQSISIAKAGIVCRSGYLV